MKEESLFIELLKLNRSVLFLGGLIIKIMNSRILLFFFIFSICNYVNAQSLLLGGNPDSGFDGLTTTPTSNELGSTQATDIHLITSGTQRLSIMGSTGANQGFIGLNTNNPGMLLHVDDGGVLVTGTTGTNPDLGAGTVLMWIPDAQAFRAGTAVGTEWDSGDVGTNSFAFGEDVTASGNYSVSFGENNVSSNTASFSGGLNNTSDGLHSFKTSQAAFISTPWK
jgi:hypothetical protein